MKKTVVFDFDGVVHSYTSGWKGADVIPDAPVPGMKEVIDELRAKDYEVIIMSSRATSASGRRAIKDYLKKHEIVVDGVTNEKPAAVVYIDDRGICFDGHVEMLLNKIINFKPWNRGE